MDDMTAFERQLADGFEGLMGPSEPVDDLAVYESVTAASRSPGWGFSMLSALKLAAAAAIVALFGGLLLAGVATIPQDDNVLPAAAPSPTATAMTIEELRSGLLAEEVEPGILRVDSDGVRFLSSGDNRDIVAGYDGGIWLLRDSGFLRLGSDVFHAWPTGVNPEDHTLEVAPDGTYWMIPSVSWYMPEARRGIGLRSGDGVAWTPEPCPGEECAGVTVAPDGTPWASWAEEGGAWRVGQLGPTGWTPLDGYIPADWSPGGFDRFHFTDAGDIYGVVCMWGCAAYRYEDGTWQRTHAFSYAVDVGSDGTVWGMEGDRWNDGLVRIVNGEWSRWTDDELREMAWSPGPLGPLGIGFEHEFKVAPDGSLWARLWRSGGGVEAVASPAPSPSAWDREERYDEIEFGSAVCDGLVHFDGVTTDHFLPGKCASMDIAADGSVWALAESDDDYMIDGAIGRRLELYVITPEAVTGRP